MADTLLYFQSTVTGALPNISGEYWNHDDSVKSNLRGGGTYSVFTTGDFRPSGGAVQEACLLIGISEPLKSGVVLNSGVSFEFYNRARVNTSASSGSLTYPRVLVRFVNSSGVTKGLAFKYPHMTGSTDFISPSFPHKGDLVFDGYFNQACTGNIGDRLVVEYGFQSDDQDQCAIVLGRPSTGSNIPVSGYNSNTTGVPWCRFGTTILT